MLNDFCRWLYPFRKKCICFIFEQIKLKVEETRVTTPKTDRGVNRIAMRTMVQSKETQMQATRKKCSITTSAWQSKEKTVTTRRQAAVPSES
jgi:hypothetical protein